MLSILPLLISAQTPLAPSDPIPREFRAAWVATVANIDWPSQKNLSVDQQKEEMIRIFDTAVKIRLNAIIFQVRPSADAMYDSKLEPWSEYLTGEQGKAPYPYFDPLEFAVKEAHLRGLELHCWFNPYRASLNGRKASFTSSHISKTHPEVVKTYGNFLWMDPGEPLVQKRSLEVIRDVVHRYDIDGVHIDDYFYPYPEGGKDFPDDPSYARYQAKGGTLTRSDWRRDNVNRFVHGLYQAIKAEKPWVKFGISPFGVYRPGIPETIKAGVDQYAELYADCKKWLNEGWCDYFTPQLYWPIAQTPQSFPVLLSWWNQQNTMGRHIWPGLYTSRVGGDEGKTWKLNEILNQIEVTRQKYAESGQVHFSMKAFLEDFQGIDGALMSGPYQHRALVPSSPWLGNHKPRTPRVEIDQDGGRVTLTVKPGDAKNTRFFTYQVLTDKGRWLEPRFTSSNRLTLSLDSGTSAEEVAVTTVDREGNESEPAVVSIAPGHLNRR